MNSLERTNRSCVLAPPHSYDARRTALVLPRFRHVPQELRVVAQREGRLEGRRGVVIRVVADFDLHVTLHGLLYKGRLEERGALRIHIGKELEDLLAHENVRVDVAVVRRIRRTVSVRKHGTDVGNTVGVVLHVGERLDSVARTLLQNVARVREDEGLEVEVLLEELEHMEHVAIAICYYALQVTEIVELDIFCCKQN